MTSTGSRDAIQPPKRESALARRRTHQATASMATHSSSASAKRLKATSINPKAASLSADIESTSSNAPDKPMPSGNIRDSKRTFASLSCRDHQAAMRARLSYASANSQMQNAAHSQNAPLSNSRSKCQIELPYSPQIAAIAKKNIFSVLFHIRLVGL